MSEPFSARYDAVVVGSGFGGMMAAYPLVSGGSRVLMLERGEAVAPGAGRADPVRGFFQLTPAYTTETSYLVQGGGSRAVEEGICACVGGPSVFYGGVSLRFREADFLGAREIVGDSGAAWPFGYEELEPFYGLAERLLELTRAPEGSTVFFANSASTLSLVGASTQSRRRRTVNGRITRPYSDCL